MAEYQQRFHEFVNKANITEQTKKIDYKFNEATLIEELTKYVNKTYSEHYSKEKIQALEIIIDSGHGAGFCLGSISKYVKRYGKKGSKEDARKDLQKILHYALIQLYIHDNT